MSTPAPPPLSMTTFADFMVSDPLSQLAKVREVRRQYDKPYGPGGDFWSRWRDEIERNLRHGVDGVEPIWRNAKNNRSEQYRSACEGYEKFIGKRSIEFLGHPEPALWQHLGLVVRVNPEWLVRMGTTTMVIKLHLKKQLTINQRLANPLLYLLDQFHGAPVGGPKVAILDVHRGKLWQRRTDNRDFDGVLRMQAAAFLAGWASLDKAA